MRAERARVSRHAEIAAFTRFLADGRICLTNNAAERALRGNVALTTAGVGVSASQVTR